MWSVFLWVFTYVIKIHYNNFPSLVFIMVVVPRPWLAASCPPNHSLSAPSINGMGEKIKKTMERERQ